MLNLRTLLGYGLLLGLTVTAAVTHARMPADEGTGIITVTTSPVNPGEMRSAPPDDPNKWVPDVRFMLSNGNGIGFRQATGFPNKDACDAYLQTQDFKVAALAIFSQVTAEDSEAEPAGEPACVVRVAPSAGSAAK
jgi:hypothetical protein